MGGVLILFSIFIAMMLWMDLSNVFTIIFLLTIFWLGGIGAYDDYLKLKYKNSKGLNGRKKLLAQIAFAAAIGIYGMVPGVAEKMPVGHKLIPPTAKEQIQSIKPVVAVQLSTSEYMTKYYVPFFKDPVIQLTGGLTILGILITIFVITGSSNAVNLTDGPWMV